VVADLGGMVISQQREIERLRMELDNERNHAAVASLTLFPPR
jgi:hypothetical protein